MLLPLAVGSALAQNTANQARVDEPFGEGAFGVTWGATIEEVKGVHPDGKTDRLNTSFTTYAVRDDRTVLQLERRDRDAITFMFDKGKLRAIFVDFPDCTDVYVKLAEVIGAPDQVRESPPASDGFSTTHMGSWKGSTLSVSLQASAGPGALSCMMSVGFEEIERVDASRAELGLE